MGVLAGSLLIGNPMMSARCELFDLERQHRECRRVCV